jgi:hypothetical protein
MMEEWKREEAGSKEREDRRPNEKAQKQRRQEECHHENTKLARLWSACPPEVGAHK